MQLDILWRRAGRLRRRPAHRIMDLSAGIVLPVVPSGGRLTRQDHESIMDQAVLAHDKVVETYTKWFRVPAFLDAASCGHDDGLRCQLGPGDCYGPDRRIIRILRLASMVLNPLRSNG